MLLERANQEENGENTESDNHDEKEKHHTFELEVFLEFRIYKNEQKFLVNLCFIYQTYDMSEIYIYFIYSHVPIS